MGGERPPRPPRGPRPARIAAAGFVGYYLASYFDFLGLQYITAALEQAGALRVPDLRRALLGAALREAITARATWRDPLVRRHRLVFAHDLHTQRGNVVLGSFWVLVSALFYAAYLSAAVASWVAWAAAIRLRMRGSSRASAVVMHFAVMRDVNVDLHPARRGLLDTRC